MQPRAQPYIAIGICLVALFLAAACFAHNGWIVGAALSIALFWQQVAFVGHDLGHCAVTHSRTTDNMLGLLVNAGVGIGMSWWKSTHNVHHLVVNSADSDPDIQVISHPRVSDLRGLAFIHCQSIGLDIAIHCAAKSMSCRHLKGGMKQSFQS